MSNIFLSADDTYLGIMASFSDRDALVANMKVIFRTPGSLQRIPGTYYASYYVYADRQVTITGTIEAKDGITLPDAPVSYPQELNLNLKQGWNVVYRRFVAGNSPKGILASGFDTTSPSGFPTIDWFFISPGEIFSLALSPQWDGLDSFHHLAF